MDQDGKWVEGESWAKSDNWKAGLARPIHPLWGKGWDFLGKPSREKKGMAHYASANAYIGSATWETEMNLTREQRDLLKVLVTKYDDGYTQEFRYNATIGRTLLMFYGPGKSTEAFTDSLDIDFFQLRDEHLLTITDREKSLIGKVTELGIQTVHSGMLDQVVANFASREINREKGRIFIGHGHSHVWKELRELLEKRLDLTTDDFNREPTAGYSTTEVLQQKLDDSSFAFLVMTGEDDAGDGSLRARENVVHEIGLFQGRLGLRRAIVLLEEGCIEFSNINGLTTIRFPKGNIMAKSEEIRGVLEREKIIS